MGAQVSSPTTNRNSGYTNLPFFPPSTDLSCMIVSSICVFLATIAIGLRVYTKYKYVGRMRADDWTMIVTWMFLTVYCFCVIIAAEKIRQGPTKSVSSSDFVIAVNLLNTAEVFYISTVMVLKISIGLFFLSFVQSPPMRHLTYITVAISTIFSIAMIFFAIFQCGIYKDTWDFVIKRFTNRCVSDEAALGMTFTHGALTIITDWTFLILPFFLLHDSLMNKREKRLLCIILGFASISGIAAIARLPFIKLLAVPKSEIFAFIKSIAIFSAVEPTVGVIAGCLVTLRPLFRVLFPGASRKGNKAGYMDVPSLPTIDSDEYADQKVSPHPGLSYEYEKNANFYDVASEEYGPEKMTARKSKTRYDLEWQSPEMMKNNPKSPSFFPGRLGVLTSPSPGNSLASPEQSIISPRSKAVKPKPQPNKATFLLDATLNDSIDDEDNMAWEAQINRMSWLNRPPSVYSGYKDHRLSSMTTKSNRTQRVFQHYRSDSTEPGLPLHLFEPVQEDAEWDAASSYRQSSYRQSSHPSVHRKSQHQQPTSRQQSFHQAPLRSPR